MKFPPKTFSPKTEPIAKGAQKRNTLGGSSIDVVVDRRPRIPIWSPTLELDGAPHLLDFFIRDFQKGKDGYVADALE